MIYHESARLRIRWDDEIQAVVAEGEGYIDGDELRTGMNAGLDLFAEKKSSKWIGDMRFRRATPDVDSLWIAQDWGSRAVEAGLRWIAIIIPTSALGKMAMKRITQYAGKTMYETGFFDNLEEARTWLGSKSSSP